MRKNQKMSKVTICRKCNMNANKNREWNKIYYFKKVCNIIDKIKVFLEYKNNELYSYKVVKV